MYTQAQLMEDIMATLEATIPNVVQVALLLAVVNFVFGMLYFALTFLIRKPFKG